MFYDFGTCIPLRSFPDAGDVPVRLIHPHSILSTSTGAMRRYDFGVSAGVQHRFYCRTLLAGPGYFRPNMCEIGNPSLCMQM